MPCQCFTNEPCHIDKDALSMLSHPSVLFFLNHKIFPNRLILYKDLSYADLFCYKNMDLYLKFQMKFMF